MLGVGICHQVLRGGDQAIVLGLLEPVEKLVIDSFFKFRRFIWIEVVLVMQPRPISLLLLQDDPFIVKFRGDLLQYPMRDVLSLLILGLRLHAVVHVVQGVRCRVQVLGSNRLAFESVSAVIPRAL